jgi:hypothetical protein
MARLNTERQNKLEPLRFAVAKQKILDLGYVITSETTTELNFEFNGSNIKFFPYSGWHTGKSIIDGRGLQKLINQIKP